MGMMTKKSKLALAIILVLVLVIVVKNIQVNQTQIASINKRIQQKKIPMAIPSIQSKETALQTTGFEESQIQMLVKSEAQELYDLNNDPQSTELRILKAAQSFDQNQIKELESIAVDESRTIEERLSSVYFLKHAGRKAQAALLHVFSSPTKLFNMPAPAHSYNELNQQFEVALRTIALESVETNIHESEGTLHIPELKNNELPKYLVGLYRMVSMGEKINDPLLKKQLNLNLSEENL